ncbi:MAG: TIGR02147 family protein [Bacteriovoracaceae bacterium]|nr:TIGR02147 family protein [Bacteriovoracaceae bacterium]
MNGQIKFQKILQLEFEKLKSKNPMYSLRAFAKKISLSPSAVSEILNSKRKISKKKAQSVLDKLCVAPHISEDILQTFDQKRRLNDSDEDMQKQKYEELSIEYFKVISDWFYFAILTLAETKDFKSDPQWIAKRLNISKKDASLAVQRLKKLNMLVSDKSGNLKVTGMRYSVTDEATNIALQKTHFQALELAKNSLEHDSLDERDFCDVTMAVDPSKIEEAKKKIRAFRRSLCSFMESGEQTEVCKMNIQLFYLTKKP